MSLLRVLRCWKIKRSVTFIFNSKKLFTASILLIFLGFIPFYQKQKPQIFPWEYDSLLATKKLNFSKNVGHTADDNVFNDPNSSIRNDVPHSNKKSSDRTTSPKLSNITSSKPHSMIESANHKFSGKLDHTVDNPSQVYSSHDPNKPSDTNHRSVIRNKIYYDLSHPPQHYKMWASKSDSFCGGAYIGYNHDMAVLHNVTVNSAAAIGKRGGEDFHKLFHQSLDIEFFKFNKGFMKIVCDRVPQYTFKIKKKGESGPNDWLKSMETQESLPKDATVIPQYYIAVTR